MLEKRGEIATQEQFLLFSTIFCNLILDFCVKTRTRFSLRDKQLFEIIEVEITGVDCICFMGLKMVLMTKLSCYKILKPDFATKYSRTSMTRTPWGL